MTLERNICSVSVARRWRSPTVSDNFVRLIDIRLVNRRIEQRQEHNITRTEITQRWLTCINHAVTHAEIDRASLIGRIFTSRDLRREKRSSHVARERVHSVANAELILSEILDSAEFHVAFVADFPRVALTRARSYRGARKPLRVPSRGAA